MYANEDAVGDAVAASDIPRSQNSNLTALDAKLDEADRAVIAALPKDQRFVNPGFAPQWDV
jgi:2,5-diketo-D-gluconate reductase B